MEMQRELGKYAFFYLNQILSPCEKTELYYDIDKIFERNHSIEQSTYVKLTKFFKNEQKLSDFKKYYVDVNSNIKELKYHILAGNQHRPEEQIKGAPKDSHHLFDEGIELYKGKVEALNGIAINYCNPEYLVLAMDKGSREINIRSSLQCRNRTVDGLKLLDDECEEWTKVLHRFDHAVGVYEEGIRSASIDAAVTKLFPKQKAETLSFDDFDSAKVLEWNHHNVEEYYTVYLN